jgi:uncharacterized membrane protein
LVSEIAVVVSWLMQGVAATAVVVAAAVVEDRVAANICKAYGFAVLGRSTFWPHAKMCAAGQRRSKRDVNVITRWHFTSVGIPGEKRTCAQFRGKLLFLSYIRGRRNEHELTIEMAMVIKAFVAVVASWSESAPVAVIMA